MSLHLMECVRPLRLNPSTKLALLAFADSADAATHIGFPGIDAVMEWASVSRSRAAALVAELVDAGLLRKHRPGHRGRRAEYVVFPDGCCSAHPRPAPDPADVDLGSYPLAPGQVRTWQPDQSHPPIVVMPPVGRTLSAEKGSRGQDSVSVRASRGQDPVDDSLADRVLPTAPSPLKGSCLGPAHGTPSLTPTTTPQPPPAPPAGEPTVDLDETPASGPSAVGPDQPACAAHAPHRAANCRGCGTTPRQVRRAAQIAAQSADRDARLTAQAERSAARAAGRPAPSPARLEAIAAARAGLGGRS